MAYTKKHIGKRYKAHGRRGFKKHHKTGPTRLIVPMARQLKEPMPDRLFTWLDVNNSGYLAGATALVATFNIGLNTIQFPFDVSAGGQTLPNPVTPVATQNLAAYNNLLFNTTTGTGIYKYYRVWSVKCKISWLTQALSDTGMAVMAPQVGDNSYANTSAGVMQAAHSPGAVVKLIQAGQPGKDSTLTKTYSMPQILGIPKDEYATGVNVYTGASGAAPSITVFLYNGFRTLDQANTAQPLGIEVQLQYHVELFQRVDSVLLQN